ncbi:MAG: hypothetical protein JNM18_25475 [Planctomycetaceae bacterium]|nr:hypothetical protein [Planctomycetaceae bacterium]
MNLKASPDAVIQTIEKIPGQKVGTINGVPLMHDSEEWQRLLSQVTLEDLPVPSGASQAIRDHLRQKQKILQVEYCERLKKLPVEELPLADDGGSWCHEARQSEIVRRQAAKEQEYRCRHLRKRLPGLKALLAEAVRNGNQWEENLITVMISEKESGVVERRQRKEANKLRRALLASEKQRLTAMTLDELLLVTPANADVEKLLAGFIRSHCIMVSNMAQRVALSETAVRAMLADLGIGPAYIHQYTTGTGHSRKDVTAHYYRPKVIDALRQEIKRREHEQARQKEHRAEAKEWATWERRSGLRKPK